MAFWYSHRSLPCSAIIRELHPATDGNKYKDLQPDISRVRDLETSSHKWNVSIKSFPLGLRRPCERGGGTGHGGRQASKVL